MKPAYFFIFLFISQNLFAQDDEAWKSASKESEAYHQERMTITFPPYGFSKVNDLISKIKESYDETNALDSKVYTGLSLREKFTYNMIHGESYSQICDAMPPIQDEQKKIFGYLPDMFGEYNWSARQKDFFAEHKDSVIAIMKESIARTNKIGLNYKQAIIEMNAVSLIPLLLEIYKKNTTRKDLDILTMCMLLMKKNKDGAFLKSASYKKLYSEDSDYLAYLNYNKANEDLIIQRVTAFYNAHNK
jgi:hypothetical protein